MNAMWRRNRELWMWNRSCVSERFQVRIRGHERMSMGEGSGTGFVAGLEDVVAAETRLSGVDGEAGELTIAGFPVEEIAGRATFEEIVYLLWRDVLPDLEQLADFRRELAGRRGLAPAPRDLLRAVAGEEVPV